MRTQCFNNNIKICRLKQATNAEKMMTEMFINSFFCQLKMSSKLETQMHIIRNEQKL